MTSKVTAWVLASRPATLTAALVPVGVGTAVAAVEGGVRWDAAVAALVGASAIQIGTNFANDVFDAEKGADAEDRLGPTRVVQAGLLSGYAVRRAMWLAFAVAVVAGFYLMWKAGPVIVFIGLASIASGIAYTAGPFPLAYVGLGDLFVMLFFGQVAVVGTMYVQTLRVSELAWLASVPVGALATAILVVNNVRDRIQDARAHKRTLAVRLGKTFSVWEYGGCLALAYAIPLGMFASGRFAEAVLLPLLTLPWAVVLTIRLAQREGRLLNPVLVSTARLLLVHGFLFAGGLVWG